MRNCFSESLNVDFVLCSETDKMKVSKRKYRKKIENPNDNISNRRKEEGNEQGISKKTIRMRRYREKLKLERGEKI